MANFIVEVDAGYNIFWLARSGNWTADFYRAAHFDSWQSARRALTCAYRVKGDRFTIREG